jgi:hypothetical protein
MYLIGTLRDLKESVRLSLRNACLIDRRLGEGQIDDTNAWLVIDRVQSGITHGLRVRTIENARMS